MKMIYIPSAGRAEIQHTWKRIPNAWRKHTKIVVPEGQRKEYSKHIWREQIIECPKKTIGETRQWIIDTTPADDVLMLDDDLYFYRREDLGSIRLITADEDMVDDMLWVLFRYISDGFTHIGMGKRTEASFYLCSYRICTRVNNVHGFDVKEMRKLKKDGVRFDRIAVMEDFDVTLSLLEMGIPNKVLLDYVWNQPGSNSKGGCSSYRTPEVQTRAAHALKKLHPEFVEVVTKKTISKADWAGMKERTDVKVAWHKAYSAAPHPHWQIEREHLRR